MIWEVDGANIFKNNILYIFSVGVQLFFRYGMVNISNMRRNSNFCDIFSEFISKL